MWNESSVETQLAVVQYKLSRSISYGSFEISSPTRFTTGIQHLAGPGGPPWNGPCWVRYWWRQWSLIPEVLPTLSDKHLVRIPQTNESPILLVDSPGQALSPHTHWTLRVMLWHPYTPFPYNHVASRFFLSHAGHAFFPMTASLALLSSNLWYIDALFFDHHASHGFGDVLQEQASPVVLHGAITAARADVFFATQNLLEAIYTLKTKT